MQNCRYSGLCQWVSESHSVLSDSLWPHGLYSPWNSPGQNTGVGGLSLLQGIFPTQGLNPGLPHFRQILYKLSYKGSPKIGWNDLLIAIRQESCQHPSWVIVHSLLEHLRWLRNIISWDSTWHLTESDYCNWSQTRNIKQPVYLLFHCQKPK